MGNQPPGFRESLCHSCVLKVRHSSVKGRLTLGFLVSPPPGAQLGGPCLPLIPSLPQGPHRAIPLRLHTPDSDPALRWRGSVCLHYPLAFALAAVEESKDCLSGSPGARSFLLPSACPCPLLPVRREVEGSCPRRACGVPSLCQPVTHRAGDSGTERKAVRPRLKWADGLGFITPGGVPAACPAAYPPTGRLRGPLLGLVYRASPATVW